MTQSVRFHTFNAGGVGWWLRSVRAGDGAERWLARFAPDADPVVLREAGALELAAPARSVSMIPGAMRLFGVKTTYAVGLVARAAERVSIGGRDFDLPAATACSGLVERRGASRGWVWAHGHAFQEPLWVEALAGYPRGGPVSIYAREKQEWRFNTLLGLAKNRSVRRPSPVGWRFSATAHNCEIVVDVRCAPSRLAGVTYVGPSGAKMYCYNTEVASMRVELRTRATVGFPWSARSLECEGQAHFEIASPEAIPGLRLHIE